MYKLIFTCIFLLGSRLAMAQVSEGLTGRFSFDRGIARNDVNAAPVKAAGVTLTEDRFGNPASACYLHGSRGSYLNLGTYPALKPAAATISIWFRMDNIMYAGKGYDGNPIILTKTHGGNDFFEAYSFATDFTSKRVSVVSSHVTPRDSVQAGVRSNNSIQLARWYHAVMCYNDSFVCLYMNGVLQNSVSKNFRTTFLAGDSVMVGYTANTKNVRVFNGAVDDILIFNRVLSPQEVMALYKAPDPNRNHHVIRLLLIILSGAAGIVLLMLLLLKRERIKSRKQRQAYEMEMQVIKAQMNPHFIFNAINSVQQFVLAQDTDNAYKYLVKFSRLVRMILENNHAEYITLESEIDILTRYIEIEALRFEHSFTYEVVTDAGINTSRTRIPQMLIQPLVENAIWHGLLPKKQDRRLAITFKYVDKYSLTCIIDDNGVGRNKGNVPEETVSQKRSLAISFIYQRLELMRRELKRDYSIHIIDKTDEQGQSAGTQVVIRLPILN